MLDEKIIEHHQAQLKFHRILYGLLTLLVFIVYCWEISEASIVYLWILLITFILCGIETVFSKFVFWNRLYLLKGFTFVQYIAYLLMIYWTYETNIYLTIGLSALMLTYMFEFSYYNDISDDLKNVKSVLMLVLPALGCMIVSFCTHGVKVSGFMILLGYLMLCIFDVLIVHMFYLKEHQMMNNIQILLSQVDAMEDSNEELVKFKNRIQKVNEELNLQRVQLGKMNQEIQQSNTELAVQAEILKFINSSFSMDIPCIANYTIDVIMRVRNVEFCGIYIDTDVCYNSKAINICKCASDSEMTAVSEMKQIFEKVSDEEENRMVIKEFPSDQYPALSKTKVRAMLVLPLVIDNHKYGIIASGSKYAHVFDNYITFYDVIVPQFDLAIHNIRMYAQMRHIAQTDGLTGINNRTYFNKLFAEQMEKTVRNKESLTVALFDIDKFKRINDTYGHLVGDEVIKSIAHIAANHIEASGLGFICRYGGEEFVLTLPNMGVDEALPIIQKLHEDIASTTVEAYGQIVTMNVSIGVSSYPQLCNDVNQLIKRADWSMYYAKEHGRGQIKVDGPDIKES